MLIFILNILWFVLGGFFAGLGWILACVAPTTSSGSPARRQVPKPPAVTEARDSW